MRIIQDFLLHEAELGMFKSAFADIRKKINEIKGKMSDEAVTKLTTQLEKALNGKGLTIQLLSVKLGKFRGHPYITSAKIEVTNTPPFMDVEDEKLVELLDWLKTEWSPKFKIKSVADGVAKFNVR